MSNIGKTKMGEKRDEKPAPTVETLWRIRRHQGGLVIEEVECESTRVRTVKRHAHDVFDLALARLGSLLLVRFGQ